jgi:signal transduction histidine kinase
MSGWRPFALAVAVAATGALGTLFTAAAAGMGATDLAHLGVLLLPAVAVTVVSAAAARPLLARASFRQRLTAIGAVAVVAGLANLGVLAALMFVDPHDALLMATLLAYSAGAGIAAAVVVARSSATAVDRLTATAGELAGGNLEARTGPLDAGPELEALAEALDDMAERLLASLTRERAVEARRRDLITAVSHDLRTPLAGLRAMVEAIDEGVVDDPTTIRRYTAEMARAVESLTSLVDDLFELVQLDAGAVEAEAKRARLDDVVRSAILACEAQAAEKGLVVEQSLDGAGGVLCSPRLIRVIQNLLQNAIRHTSSDGIVRIEARRAPGRLEIRVEDTGEGIAPDALDRVFEPFWRGDPARSGEGTGLGLALAKRIVEALGGDIRVESVPAHGSRFEVLLPARPEDGGGDGSAGRRPQEPVS